MLAYAVETPQRSYQAVVERGVLRRVSDFVPAGPGKIFIVTTPDVWKLYGEWVETSLADREIHPLFFPAAKPASVWPKWRFSLRKCSSSAVTARVW